MSDQDNSFRALIVQVQQGSQEAAGKLAKTYGPHVQRYVRRSISRELRNRFDSLDFVQLVWASFFCEPQDVPNLETPAQLVAYLGRMAQNKVVDEGRRLQTQKADSQRELRIDRGGEHAPVYGRDPTPSAVAIFREQYDALVTQQPDKVGQIARLRFEGATYPEIAEQLHISERHARRTIARLQTDRNPPAADEKRTDEADTDAAES